MVHKFMCLGQRVVMKKNPWIGRGLAKSEYVISGLPVWTGKGSKVHGATADVNKIFKFISKALKSITAKERVLGIKTLMTDIVEGGIVDRSGLESRISVLISKSHPATSSTEQLAAKRAITKPLITKMAATL